MHKLAFASLLLISTAAVACIWDRDTLATERARFPSALELITGRFPRHSPEYYRWRIADRQKKLKAAPRDLALIDDLAVAYEKVGDHEKAIELMRGALAIQPKRYETEANLGTFLLHAGKIDQGLEHIDAAMAINPDAHFGRERYQAELARYVQERKTQNGGALKLPLRRGKQTFVDFLLRNARAKKTDATLSAEDQQKAVQGVLGMMRFGDHRSPVLLEALGDLLRYGWIDRNAKALAFRAYSRAAELTTDPATKKRYSEFAVEPSEIGGGVDAKKESAELKQELAAADAWYARLVEDEKRWIRTGADVDREFEQKYMRAEETVVAPQVAPDPNPPRRGH